MTVSKTIAAVLGGGLLLCSARVRGLDLDFVPVGRYSKPPGGAVGKILVSGKHAFIAQLPEIHQNTGAVGRGGGLHVVSIEDPTNPKPVAMYPTGVILDFAMAGTNLVLLEEPRSHPDGARTGGGLHVIDMRDANNLRRTGLYPWPSNSSFYGPLAMSGNRVYLWGSASGGTISVVDISDASKPKLAGSFKPTNWLSAPSFLLAKSNYLYAAESDKIRVLEVADSSTPRSVATYFAGATIRSAALREYRLYLATESSLRIVDVTVPQNPMLVGQLTNTLSQPTGLSVEGNHAYLLTFEETRDADGYTRRDVDGKVHVIDIRMPAAPKGAGGYENMDAKNLAAAGSLAFLSNPDGFRTLDLSDPAQPTLAGIYAVRSDARDVALMDSYAIVADGFAGLEIIDVNDPSSPQLAGSYPMAAPANSVTIHGNLGYVAAGGGMHVVDLSSVSSPKRIGFWQTPGDAQKVVIGGNYALVPVLPFNGAAGDGGLQILEIANPTAPRWIGSYGTAARDVTVSSNLAYVVVPTYDEPSLANELHVVDITNPGSPERKLVLPTRAQSVARSGELILVTSRTFGFRGWWADTLISILDPRNPAFLVPLGSYSHRGDRDFRDLDVFGNIAFATDHTVVCSHSCSFEGASVRAIDISDPMNPHPIGAYRLPDYPEELPTRRDLGVATSGTLVFVAGGGSGLHVLKTTAANPQRAGTYKSSLPLSNLAISGDQAYLAESFWDPSIGQSNRLEVIDISSSATPQPVAAHSAEHVIVAVAPLANGTLLLEASSVLTNGSMQAVTYLKVLDMTNPGSPLVKATYSRPGEAVALATSGSFAYLMMRGGLEILDLSDPAQPVQAGIVHPSDRSLVALAVDDRHAYLVEDDSTEGILEIIDVHRASGPLAVGRLTIPGVLLDVKVVGDYAYLAEQPRWSEQGLIGGGLLIVDVRDPTAPRVLGRCLDGAYARSVAVLGEYIYLLDGNGNDGGIHVIDARNPERPRRVARSNVASGHLSSITAGRGKVFANAGALGLYILHAYRPISFESVSSSANGAVNLSILGPPSVPADLQSSADLKIWVDVMPITFSEGALNVSRPTGGSARFYRVTTETR